MRPWQHVYMMSCTLERVIETVRYTYRLRPGAVAERALEAEWHRCRFLWNEAVHQQKSGRKPTLCKLSKLLTEARGKFAWLREGSQMAQQQTLRTYAVSLDHSYKIKGRGRPTIKKRDRALPSLEYTDPIIRENRLCLPKGITIPVVWSRPLPSRPTTVRVRRDSLGHWYAGFVVRREVRAAPVASGAIGIDWGITTTATTTNTAYDLPYAGHRKRCAAELARTQRMMSRRQRPRGQVPSNGYRQAKRATAKIGKKAARQVQHDGRVWARSVVAVHQTIGVEDFRARFLAKSTLARKAADAAIGKIKHELLNQGTRAGRRLVLVPPAYTTMTCSSCFARAKQRLGLAERTFRCAECGYVADRDRNAARVILAVAERNHAGIDDVRHCSTSPPGVVVTVRSEPEIPAV